MVSIRSFFYFSKRYVIRSEPEARYKSCMKTADLYDQFEDQLQVALPIFRSYGRREFQGVIATVKVYEDNALVRKQLEQEGRGRVLVIDGAGSLRTALVGDQIASLAASNGWAGLVIHGCIRDVEAIELVELGIRALGSTPRKSSKRGTGEVDLALTFAGVRFVPGQWLCADADGIVLAERELTAPPFETFTP